jgi:hypothetical protein
VRLEYSGEYDITTGKMMEEVDPRAWMRAAVRGWAAEQADVSKTDLIDLYRDVAGNLPGKFNPHYINGGTQRAAKKVFTREFGVVGTYKDRETRNSIYVCDSPTLFIDDALLIIVDLLKGAEEYAEAAHAKASELAELHPEWGITANILYARAEELRGALYESS